MRTVNTFQQCLKIKLPPFTRFYLQATIKSYLVLNTHTQSHKHTQLDWSIKPCNTCNPCSNCVMPTLFAIEGSREGCYLRSPLPPVQPHHHPPPCPKCALACWSCSKNNWGKATSRLSVSNSSSCCQLALSLATAHHAGHCVFSQLLLTHTANRYPHIQYILWA